LPTWEQEQQEIAYREITSSVPKTEVELSRTATTAVARILIDATARA
jgi:hypothetical protein